MENYGNNEIEYHQKLLLSLFMFTNNIIPVKACRCQGRSKVFTTGQARIEPQHYVIKCVGS